MRKIYPAFLGVSVTAAVLILHPAPAEITGSKHDFSGKNWNTSGEVCLPCHSAHNANSALVPLWNHETTTALFQLYEGETFDATDLGQPEGVSKACLSCHDGSVALDAFGGKAGSRMIARAANLGTDLTDDHPISFTYQSSLDNGDGTLAALTDSNGEGGTIEDWLVDGRMECSSCHDVHNTANVEKLLLKDNARSALCFTCHKK